MAGQCVLGPVHKVSFTLIKNKDIIFDIFIIFLQQILSSKLLLAIAGG